MSKFARFLPLILLIAIYAAWTAYRMFWDAPKGPHLDCQFVSAKDQAPVRIGNVNAPLSQLRISGTLVSRDSKDVYDLKGRASYLASEGNRKFSATGLIATGPDKRVRALALQVGGISNNTTNDFGRDGILVSTLGPDGYLGDDASTAYVGSERALKTAYPTTYQCRISGND